MFSMKITSSSSPINLIAEYSPLLGSMPLYIEQSKVACSERAWKPFSTSSGVLSGGTSKNSEELMGSTGERGKNSVEQVGLAGGHSGPPVAINKSIEQVGLAGRYSGSPVTINKSSGEHAGLSGRTGDKSGK